MAFEERNREEEQVNFGIGAGVRSREFSNANPGVMITTEGNFTSSASGVMLQDSDRVAIQKYQSTKPRFEVVGLNPGNQAT